ncbi:hypothetical protein JTB14_034390 [Gonioctena quinquepunctata]|nr:hypothetical protein JTB14_034390 [Gonioctena quinquepunctata]
MLIKAIILIISCFSCAIIASPVPSKKGKDASDEKVLYDQRQEGGLNVRADLDNFIIMIIPSQTLPSDGSSSSLLDFFRKSLPKRSYLKRVKHKKHQRPSTAHETMHFIESKTSPYHVDITENKSNLESSSKDELLASSPAIALVTSDLPVLNGNHKRSRISRHFVVTVPAEEEFILTRTPEAKSGTIKRKTKKTIKETSKTELKLLGAENEECGPGLARDSYGVCRTYSKV